jgi:hypothetical protein
MAAVEDGNPPPHHASQPSTLSEPLLSDCSLARRVAAAVLAAPGVRALSPGPAGAVATYGPGERVEGVRLRQTGAGLVVEVRVVLDTLALLPAAARVRAAATGAVAAAGQPLARVDVYVDDLQVEPDRA